MKKVLFVHDGPIYTDSRKTVFYGVHYSDDLIERYSYFGDKVSFLMRSKVFSEDEALNFSVLKHPKFSFIEVPDFKSISSYSQKSKATDIIKKAVDEHDVIILRLPSATGAIAFKYAQKINKPILIEKVACVYDALWNYDWRGKLMANYKMKKYQKILQKASHTIYVTNEFLQNRYPTKGKSIGCSDVLLSTINTTILDNRLHKIQNMKTPLVLGTVAAVDVFYKGQTDVIKAVAQLKKQGLQIKYKIVGQGNPQRLADLIKTLKVEDLVEIVGPLRHDKIFEFIDTIDLYIQPSLTEGLPRAVIEAISRGCPAVGSDVGGIPELVCGNALFQAGNVKEIIKLLSEIQKDDLEKWAKENFKKALEFTPETLDDKREKFYKEFKQDYNLQ